MAGDFDFSARALRDSARVAGWAAEVFLDVYTRGSLVKKWVLANVDQPEAWCALCYPTVVARCPLHLRMAVAPAIVARLDRAHVEVASKLLRRGQHLRRLQHAAEPTEAEGAFLRRMEGELKPLEREVAVRLSALLDPGLESNDSARALLASRWAEVIEVLHTPPSERWTGPQPPLEYE